MPARHTAHPPPGHLTRLEVPSARLNALGLRAQTPLLLAAVPSHLCGTCRDPLWPRPPRAAVASHDAGAAAAASREEGRGGPRHLHQWPGSERHGRGSGGFDHARRAARRGRTLPADARRGEHRRRPPEGAQQAHAGRSSGAVCMRAGRGGRPCPWRHRVPARCWRCHGPASRMLAAASRMLQAGACCARPSP